MIRLFRELAIHLRDDSCNTWMTGTWKGEAFEAFREELRAFIDTETRLGILSVSSKRVSKLGHTDFIVYYVYMHVYMCAYIYIYMYIYIYIVYVYVYTTHVYIYTYIHTHFWEGQSFWINAVIVLWIARSSLNKPWEYLWTYPTPLLWPRVPDIYEITGID
jgi:hypothetical protein